MQQPITHTVKQPLLIFELLQDIGVKLNIDRVTELFDMKFVYRSVRPGFNNQTIGYTNGLVNFPVQYLNFLLQVTFLFLAELSLIVGADFPACHPFSQLNQQLIHANFRRNQEEYGISVYPVAVTSFVGNLLNVGLQVPVYLICIHKKRRMGDNQR